MKLYYPFLIACLSGVTPTYGVSELQVEWPSVTFVKGVDGSPRICEIVRYFCKDITVKGAWEGPAALQLFNHALAPVAALPVLQVISGVHILSDLTLALGTVVHDYLVTERRNS
jgi:acetoacetate decarboxylase